MPPDTPRTGLQASHPDNTHAATHGAFSRDSRVLAPRVEEIRAELTEQDPEAHA